MNHYLVFLLKALKYKDLRPALRHNRREMSSEVAHCAHIDPARTCSNYPLLPHEETEKLVQLNKDLIDKYEHHFSKKIRHDAIVAIELMFSWPAHKNKSSTRPFFEDCLKWSKHKFEPALLVSADVHLDESTPHLHVIFLCITPTSLLGSKLKGYKGKYRERQEDFFYSVGQKYGLSLPPEKLRAADRLRLGSEVLSCLQSTDDPALKSTCFSAIRLAIETNPIAFATNLGIEVKRTEPANRSFTQIMISKGKGNPNPNHCLD
jgi:Plasmid recombination enzyme